jgi:hypothetical protein
MKETTIAELGRADRVKDLESRLAQNTAQGSPVNSWVWRQIVTLHMDSPRGVTPQRITIS